MIIGILLVGVLLRGYMLANQSIWIDEALTFFVSKGSLADVVSQSYIKTNIPPLYYLILHTIVRTASQDEILRLPSLIFGSLSIFVFYKVVCNWLGRTFGLVSAMIMAISPFHIWYSQEARPYALLIFLSLLSIWLLQESIKREKNSCLKLGFALSAASTFYCHTVAIPFIGFLGMYVLLALPREKRKNWLPVFGAIVLLILPGFYGIVTAPLNTSDPYRSFSLLFLPYTVWTFATGYSIGPTLSELHMPDRISYVISYLHIILPAMLCISTLLVLGGLYLLRKDNFLFLATMLWFLCPLVFTILASIFTSFSFNVRYTILSFPPFVIFLAVGVKSLKVAPLRLITFGLIGIVSAFSLANYFFDERYQKDNNRAAGDFLTAHAQTHDLVICSAPYTLESLKYYYNGGWDLTFARYPMDNRYVEPSVLESDLNRIIADRDRFWLFLSRTYHSDPEGYIHKYCDQYFRRDLELRSNGVELILYRRR